MKSIDNTKNTEEFNQITRLESKKTNCTSKDSSALLFDDLVEETMAGETSELNFLTEQNLPASSESPTSIGANDHFANDLRLTK